MKELKQSEIEQETHPLVQSIVENSELFASRLELLEHCAKNAPEGTVLEFGVFQGRSLLAIKNVRKGKVVGFDSFEGLPEDWDAGGVVRPAGHFACEPPKELPRGVTLEAGWFEETLPRWLESNREVVSFVHIDCDLYSSTKTVLEKLDDRIRPGTILLFDELLNLDDGFNTNWEQNEFKALKEWLEEYDREVQPVARTNSQQVAFIVRK